MKKPFLNVLKLLIFLYILVCAGLYFFQEKLIFAPKKLSDNYQFQFTQKFSEIKIKSSDGALLDGVLFKTDSSKGLIFYLHGKGANISGNADVASFYTRLHYDVFMFDYRGFGKSEGAIHHLDQLFQDNQIVYDEMKKSYPENKIIVLGYSLGTGFAAKLASANHPKLLILQAPYFSIKDMMRKEYSLIPTFILKYNIATNDYIKNCTMPIVDFHGTNDSTVYYGSSLKLKQEFNSMDTLITMNGQGHNHIIENIQYKNFVTKLLK